LLTGCAAWMTAYNPGQQTRATAASSLAVEYSVTRRRTQIKSRISKNGY